MRKSTITLVVIAVIAALASCKRDPIHDTIPVDTSFWAGNVVDAQGYTVPSTVDAYFPLEEFRALGEKNDTASQRAMVDKYRKVLTANVVAHYPQIQDENSIHFVLGSGYARKVMSGNNKTYSGPFKNELIIIIHDKAVKDTVFLACGNGMLSPLEFKSQSNWGTATPWRFVIKENESLAKYVPKLEDWGKVAADLGIVILKNGEPVSQEIYMKDPDNCKSLLFKGDVIDLVQERVFNEAGQEVQFQRRIEESRKENARRARKRR